MQLLRKLTYPISFIYLLVVFLRNKLYDWGVFSSKSYNIPLIGIGNLSVGGTGKTPMVEYVIRELQDFYKIATLSRGYGRKSKGFLLANEKSTVTLLGDEPFQIFSKYKSIAVAVDADRQNGINCLLDKVAPEVIVLDDVYQHRKVKPGLLILLTAYKDLYVDDWYLPTGNLRDLKGAAKRANIIIVTKCPETISNEEKNTIAKRIYASKGQLLFFSVLAYNNYVKGAQNSLLLEELKGKEFCLVTGIANPDPLVAHLHSLGLVFKHLAYRDHHFFTDKELALFNKQALIVTTEKDYTRLENKVGKLYSLGVSHQFLGGDEASFKNELVTFMKS